MDQLARIRSIIKEFDAQGHHRTGTRVDHESGAWLRDVLRESGVDAELESYPFSRLVPGDASVSVGDERLDGLPGFDSILTTEGGVHGRLGPLGSAAEIGLCVVNPGGPAPELDAAREANTHRAIVCLTVGPRPGLAPRNATAYLSPYGPPLLQVSSEHRKTLEQWSGRGAESTLKSSGSRVDGQASNVIARIPGQNAALAPIVVMTPRSGWWQCASERGGGMACLAEVGRAFARAPLQRDLLLLASTGHELGHWGLERFLGARPQIGKDALLWLHLGASVGAALDPRPLVFGSDEPLRALARGAIDRARILPPPVAAPSQAVPGGESKNIHERGGRYVSFLGGSAVFHLEADRWPAAVDVDAVAAYAAVCIDIVREADAKARSTPA